MPKEQITVSFPQKRHLFCYLTGVSGVFILIKMLKMTSLKLHTVITFRESRNNEL